MDFLTMEDSFYSAKGREKASKKNTTKDKVNIILSLVDRGLETKEQTEENDFAGGLSDKDAKYYKEVLKSKPTNQEKAIISALLNKYPKLYKEEAQQREFREHVENLLNEGKLEDGALKYLLSRLLEKEDADKDKKRGKEEEQVEEVQPEGQPEGGEEEGEGAQPAVSQEQMEAQQAGAAQEGAYSDFYSEWEKEFNDTDIDLTEDQFNDLLAEEELKQLLGEDKLYASLSEKFLVRKLTESMSKEREYSSLMVAEDFILDRVFSNKEFFKAKIDNSIPGVTNKEIENLKGIINGKLPQDYINYLKEYGFVSLQGRDLYGLGSNKFFNTFKKTKELQLNFNLAKHLIVLEDLGIGDMYLLLNLKDQGVYKWRPNGIMKKIYGSFSEFLKKDFILDKAFADGGSTPFVRTERQVPKDAGSNSVIDNLNSILSNLAVLSQNARAVHWNIRGDKFFELHKKFGKIYDYAQSRADDVAERILMLGGTPNHTMESYIKSSTVKVCKDVSDAREAVRHITIALEEILSGEHSTLNDVMRNSNDEGTKNLLSDMIEEQEKTLWMFKSWLGDSSEKTYSSLDRVMDIDELFSCIEEDIDTSSRAREFVLNKFYTR